jgi:hypothetical protein
VRCRAAKRRPAPRSLSVSFLIGWSFEKLEAREENSALPFSGASTGPDSDNLPLQYCTSSHSPARDDRGTGGNQGTT